MALTQKAEAFLDLPLGTLSGEAQVEIVGTRQVTVDGSCDILAYDETGVRLKTRQYAVHISGENLRIDSLYDNGACVSGKITAIEFS